MPHTDSRERLYEQLVTRAVERWLGELVGLTSEVKDADPGEISLRLARHVAAEAERALRSLKTTGIEQQVALCNALLRELHQHVPETGAKDSEIVPPPRLLLGVHRNEPPVRPKSPLAISTLLTRARTEPALGHELAAEIASADRIDALVSFVTVGGFRSLREDLELHAQRERPFRLLTTTYMGATDADAVESIARLPGAAVRVSYDDRRTRLHAKAWLFHRESGLSTAYIGSANLSQAALFGGHEWMMKVAEADLPHVIEKFRGAFDSLWEDAEFEPFCPEDEAARNRLRQALRQEPTGLAGAAKGFYFTLAPLPFQSEILDQLEAERTVHGRCRNLLVAATGTGKTIVAAFDYQRQIGGDGLRPRLLFLAHREEILRQAVSTFRHVLRDEAFGELLTGRDQPTTFDHLFATIQSARSQNLLEHYPPDHWRFVVVDECHHIPAPTYQNLVPKLRPEILVGLTATPERTDGKSLLPDFDDHIAADIRLWHAIDRQLLVPFEYFGLHDGVDLRHARWSRGAYVDEDLSNLYTGNDRRAELVIEQLRRLGGDTQRLRAVGFCVSVAHAEFMARKFRGAGIQAEAVHGETAHDVRTGAPQRLERRQVNVLFTCDLYNEGVDMPWVDTLLLLRPTASAMLFLQQLGRGLRNNRGKGSCLVLDFIGQHRQEFRFDHLLSAVTGVQRGRLRQEVEEEFPTLPSGCTFHLDRVARGVVLESLKQAVGGGMQRLAKELRQLVSNSPAAPWTLMRYLDASGRDIRDIYAAGGWTALRRQAGLLSPLAPEGETNLNARFRRLLHIDDPRRLDFYTGALRGGEPRPLTETDRRRLLMLGYQLWDDRNRLLDAEAVVSSLTAFPALREELIDLFAILKDRVQLASTREPFPDWPLVLHRQYGRREIAAAVGHWTPTKKPQWREGLLRIEESKIELFVVTLDKSGSGFSPTTRYEDYAVSPRLFHWQSQSTTSDRSPTGLRYIEQQTNGWRFLLFVRERQEDAFTLLGDVRHREHRGSRPISITWELEEPIPAAMFQRYATLAAA